MPVPGVPGVVRAAQQGAEPSRRQCLVALCAMLASAANAQSAGRLEAAQIGVVLMHGKGGQPTGLIAALSAYLQEQGFGVRNLEMPWSGRRQYDASPAHAQQQVLDAFAELRQKGAVRQVLAGHSQGAIFALHLAASVPLDALVAIAPGGNTGTALYAQKIGAHLQVARTLVAAGRGDETGDFADYEGSKGMMALRTRAAHYAAWFDPQGVMHQERALRAVPSAVPVLYLGPTGDYPVLVRANPNLFALLPHHPASTLEFPEASHASVPTAARERIAAWLRDTLSH